MAAMASTASNSVEHASLLALVTRRWAVRTSVASALAATLLLLGRASLRWLHRLSAARPLPSEPKLPRRLRVAVVGAGVGGSALACWLRDLYGDDLELTVVSDGPVGGRCQAAEAADGRHYEGGASIISELNEYFMGFMRRLGLKEKYFKRLDIPLGVFDGERFLVREVDPAAVPFRLKRIASLWSTFRMIYRYGLRGLMRMKKVMKHSSSPQFPRLYKLLRQGKAFHSVEALLQALGPDCVQLTRSSASSWLTTTPPAGGGLPSNIVDELITCGMRANYGGQGCLDLHSFVGLVSVAGGGASRCFQVAGGNQQVPRGLLKTAHPDCLLLDTTVRRLRRVAGAQTWELLVEPDAAGEAMKGFGSPAKKGKLQPRGPFDIVVLAHPLARSCISFEGLHRDNDVTDKSDSPKCDSPKAVADVTNASELLLSPAGFRRCVTHFVRGKLKPSYFSKGIAHGASECPPMCILTVAGSSAPFYSLALALPVDLCEEHDAQQMLDNALRGEISTFKVFAPEILTESQLDDIFERREGKTEVLDWYAYPQYSVPQPMMPFVLDGSEASVLYLNAIEDAASAMEMSAVSARNAANLVVEFVNKHRQKWRTDQMEAAGPSNH